MTGRESQHPTFGRLDGPVVMVGFGSIGRGTLPLILRHFEVDPADIVVIAPDTQARQLPAGPQGVSGATGPQRATGPQGAKGETGGSGALRA